MILPALALAGALVLADPGPSLIGGHLTSLDDRLAAIAEGSRGTASAIRTASRFPSRWTRFAACVLDRESGGTLDRPQSGSGALNTQGSSASGRWQFLAKKWQHSLPYMVADALRAAGMPDTAARTIRRYLDRLPLHRWPGVYQDIGFIAVVTAGENGQGEGWRHWSLRGSHCDALVPAGA